MDLFSSVRELHGVGPARAAQLEKLGIRTLYDLLAFFPRDYADRTNPVTIAQLQPGVPACFRAMVVSQPVLRRIGGGRDITKLIVADETGKLTLSYFNQPYVKNQLHYGESYCTMSVLRSPLACACAWIGTLAVFAGFGRWANRETRFTRHMRQSGFAYYVLHLPLMLLCALALDRALHAPAIVIYPALLVLEALLLPPLAALVRRIPVLRTLLLGL